MTIRASQLGRFWFLYLISNTMFFMFGVFLRLGRYSGWLSLLIAVVQISLMTWGAVKLASYSESKGWFAYGGKLVTRPVHAVFATLMIGNLAAECVLSLNYFSRMIVYTYLFGTPRWVIVLVLVTCVTMAAWSGIATVVAMFEGMLLFALMVAVLIVVGLPGQMTWEMAPALITNLNGKDVLMGSGDAVHWLNEVVFVFLLVPYLRGESGKALRQTLAGLACAAAFLLVFWFICLDIFGADGGAHIQYPLKELAQLTKLGEFLENIDPAIIFVWSLLIYLKAAFLLALIAKGTVDWFGMRGSGRKATIWWGAAILLIILFIPQDPAKAVRFIMSIPFTLWIDYVPAIPLLYLAVWGLRFRFRKEAEA